MTSSWVVKTPARDAVFHYTPTFLSSADQEKLLAHVSQLSFQPCTNGRGHTTRLQSWYQDQGRYFCEPWSGRYARWCAQETTSTLQRVRVRLEDHLPNRRTA